MRELNDSRTRANARSGFWSAVLAALVFTRYFLSSHGWDISELISPENIESYLDGLWQAVLGVGGAAALARDLSPGAHPRHAENDAPAVRPSMPPVRPPPPSALQRAVPDSTWVFGAGSRAQLALAHPDVQEWMELTLRYSPIDFGVTESWRSVEDQRRNVVSGASETMDSAHTYTPALAVDVLAYIGSQHTYEFSLYADINKAAARAARELGLQYIWGGVWASRDGVHFEVDRTRYTDVTKPDISLA